MRAARSARALMTTNNVCVLAATRRGHQFLVADRNEDEGGAIAVRAIKRLAPHLEVRPVTNLGEAESQLAQQSVATVFVASGLDSRTPGETIRWLAQKIAGAVIIALLGA